MLIQGPAVLTPQPTAHSCLACGDATGIHVSDKRPHVPPVNSYVLLAPARKILSDSKTHCGPVPLTSDAPRVLETHNVPLPSCYHQPLSSNKARYLGQENQEFPESHPHLYLVVLGKRSQGEPARRGPLQFKVCAQAGGGWILAGVQSAPCQTPRVAPLVTQLPPSGVPHAPGSGCCVPRLNLYGQQEQVLCTHHKGEEETSRVTSVFPASAHCSGGTWLSSAREISVPSLKEQTVGFTSARAKPNDQYERSGI